MADAEKLLHEAQYAFASITFGESLGNTRNRARARKLSMKILKQFPDTMYAQEAHAILMRLGDEAFTRRCRYGTSTFRKSGTINRNPPPRTSIFRKRNITGRNGRHAKRLPRRIR